MLSIGKLKPTYYAFFDDNVLYDGEYAGIKEGQNTIGNRIKNETQYLEGFINFEDLQKKVTDRAGQTLNFLTLPTNPTQDMKVAARNIYRYDKIIGDAYLEGETNKAPAWKVVTLQGRISGSSLSDTLRSSSVPQVDIDVNYTLRIQDAELNFDPSGVRDINNVSARFIDNRVIKLDMDDVLIYVEEMNTQILTENYDIEIFEIEKNTSDRAKDRLTRKYFEREIPQIEDGFMKFAQPIKNPEEELTMVSVEYYFDALVDSEINPRAACQGAEIFNKQSYYVDLDFECDDSPQESIFYDIYGKVTEPEICLD